MLSLQSLKRFLGIDGRGFVAINNEGVEWNNAFDCGLPDGTYCDIVAGGKNGAQCTGSTYVASPLSSILVLGH